MERDQLLDLLYEQSLAFVSRTDFAKGLQDWEVHEMVRRGALVAIFVSKGPEFHFAKVDPAYSFTRDDLREWPGALIERHGYALTRTPKEDERQLRFNRRLGFVAVGEDEYDVHQRIERLRGKD